MEQGVAAGPWSGSKSKTISQAHPFMFQIWLQCHLHVFRTMPWVGMLDPSTYCHKYLKGRCDLAALVVLFKIACIATQDMIRNEGAHLVSNISTVSANGMCRHLPASVQWDFSESKSIHANRSLYLEVICQSPHWPHSPN